jgi:cytochrome b
MKPILVWDIPTRLFHWILAGSFAIAWLSSESDQWLSVHTYFGYLMLGLIGFRLVWGFVGGHYARFASFLFSPQAGLAYVLDLWARRAKRHLGHNPAGSQAIYLLLILGLLVGVTGIFTQGGEEQQSAAAGVLSIHAGSLLKNAHELFANLMLLVVLGHLAGVAIESWLHKENLPRSMVTGIKVGEDGAPVSQSFKAVGGLLVLAVAAFGFWWFFYAWHEPVEKRLGHEDAALEAPHVAFVGRKLPDDPKWREECGSCHLAFHPNLLPARSWKKLMADQATHFGTDLALDAPTSAAVLSFMVANAAENSTTEAAFKINRSIKPESTPLRITETPYWVDKHSEIAAADWSLPLVKSKINCAACHLDADAGMFEDAAMRIPR